MDTNGATARGAAPGPGSGVGGAASRSAAGFVAACALIAAAVAALAWRYLPYAQLQRFSSAERFQLWEGFVWMFALLLLFLGGACIVEVVGWRFDHALREVARRLRAGIRRTDVPSASLLAAWAMLSCGLFLMLIGALGRAILAP